MLACRDLSQSKILTPKQLFGFANSEITGVTFFENSQSVKKNVPFPESRFSYCSTFKGTPKNHEFIPGGENIAMNCVSGGASKNLVIQQKEVVLSIDHIISGLLYACSYDEWYFGGAIYISVENYDVNIKFLQPNGPVVQFFKPGFLGLGF